MNSLMEVLEEVNRLDYAEFDNLPAHRFSRRSRKAMKKLLQPGVQSGTTERNIHWSRIPVRKRIVIAMLTILLAAAGITAGANAINGFKQNKYRDHTERLLSMREIAPKSLKTCIIYQRYLRSMNFMKKIPMIGMFTQAI